MAKKTKKNKKYTKQGYPKSGYIGVQWYAPNADWHVEIMKDGVQYEVGHFDDKREAARHYDTALRILRGWNSGYQENFPGKTKG